MREIKFRAWDGTEVKEVLKVAFVYNGLRAYVTKDIYIEVGADQANPEWVVMQYTGLKDKNGAGIYEGDIVRLATQFDDEGIYEIEFALNGFWLKNWDGNEFGFPEEPDLEVIGNIYENPELLK